MATFGKPTTSFYINYGTLEPAVAQRALAPALLAPRYRLHRIASGFAGTKLTSFPLSTGVTSFDWPDRSAEGSIVDVSSAKMIAKNMYLVMNDTPLSGTVGDNSLNYITVTGKSVQLVGGDIDSLATELNGYEVKPGDRVEISYASEKYYAEVVDILPEMKEAASTVTKADGSETTAVTVAGFAGNADAAYLVKVKSVDSDKATVAIEALSGDLGYTNTVELTANKAITIGDYGIELSCSDLTQLKAEDSFIVSGSAETVAYFNTIYLDIELEIPNGTAIDVVFQSSSLSPAESILSGAAWSVNGDQITVSESLPGITLGDKKYTIASADLHMRYRELLTGDLLELLSNQTADIAEWVGPADPENPMGMMYAAASVVDGAFFYVMATGSDEESTIKAINYVGQFEGAYAPIPFIQSKATQNAVAAVIAKYSNPEIAQFKHAWFCSTAGREAVIYEVDADNNGLIGTIDNNVLTLQGAGKVNAVGAKVKIGDYAVVIGGYDTDTGKFDETAYRISKVKSADTLILENAKNIGTSRVYIKRVLSGSEYAEALAAEASSWDNHRINFVASDKLSFGGFDSVDPVYLCVTLASMRCALPPHAPMNELVVPGYTIQDELKWTDVDYEKMNRGGVWVVAKNAEGEVVTYHQITTKTDGTVAEEDSVVSNGDAIVRQLRIAVRPFASGKSNVTTALLDKIRNVLIAEIKGIQAITYAATYGQRILDYKISRLDIPEGNKRSLICVCDLELPQPMQDGQFIFNLF